MELDRNFNRLVLAMAPQHIVACHAPETLNGIIQAHMQRGQLIIWSGASDRTIFGDARVNHAFRAWHDHHHIKGRHDFTLPGEVATMRAQVRSMFDTFGNNDATRYFTRVLQCEVQGQAEQYARTGAFPIDQLAFTKEYLK